VRPTGAAPLDVNLVWLDTVDSTNDAVARLAASWHEDEDDLLGDTVIVAGSQSAGRGRGQHVWESPAGGLYATWLGWVKVEELPWLPIAAGVCLAESIETLLGDVAVQLKWPNDVLVGGRKVGGVLCHSRSRGDLAWAAVGFGVNVAVEPELSAGLGTAAAWLADLGHSGDPQEAIWAIVSGMVRCLRPLLAAPGELPERWQRRAVHRAGDSLRVRADGELIVGSYVGLAANGQLELAVGGVRRLISAGSLIGGLPGGEV